MSILKSFIETSLAEGNFGSAGLVLDVEYNLEFKEHDIRKYPASQIHRYTLFHLLPHLALLHYHHFPVGLRALLLPTRRPLLLI